MLPEGQKAPDFSLQDQNGDQITLSAFLGRKVVLYFYPRDNTPGCTKEACGFRDTYSEFSEKGAVVIGISPDTQKKHAGFAGKFELPFTLLADPDKEVIQLYDVWKEKKMYGKVSMGVQRSTYIIDEQGLIMRTFPKVSPEGHASEILAILST